MYNVQPGQNRYTKFIGAFRPLVAIAQLQLEYQGGAGDTVATDAGWRGTSGPIPYSNLFCAQDCDARRGPAASGTPGVRRPAGSPAGTPPGAGSTLRRAPPP